jgi:protein TonB
MIFKNLPMLRRHPHVRWTGANAVRTAAILLIAAASWLGSAAPAAGQRQEPFAIQPPLLLNDREITRLTTERYPAAMRERGILGAGVALKFRVLADSTVDPASITVERTRDPAFVEPAMEIARGLRFSPATVDGRPVPAWYRFTLNFSAQAPSDEGTYAMTIDEPPILRNVREMERHIAEAYPAALRDRGVSGDVLLVFRVDPRGRVEPDRVTVMVWTDPAFEEAAVAVTRFMRFRPGLIDDHPVNGWVTMPIHFGPGTQ